LFVRLLDEPNSKKFHICNKIFNKNYFNFIGTFYLVISFNKGIINKGGIDETKNYYLLTI